MDEAQLRIVIDTNVWISAFISPVGAPARLISLARAGLVLVVLSDYLVDEIQDVVRRPRILRRLKLEPLDIDFIVQELLLGSAYVVTDGTLRLCRDPDDDAILETAIRGRANFLVTRDDDMKRDPDLIEHLAAQGVGIVSVAGLLQLIESAQRTPGAKD